MSQEGSFPDFRAKFIKLFGYAIIAATLGICVWGVIHLGALIFSQATHMRCQDNFRSIIAALSTYRNTYNNQLPPYLTVLLPILDNRTDKFDCPSDPNHGRKGCRPEWLRRLDPPDVFANVDLDGPTLDPKQDTDSLPCSYLYVANAYPCGFTEFERTWRQEFNASVEKLGSAVPLVRCYYHLPEKTIPDPDAPEDPRRRLVDPDVSPTHNITAELELKTYRYEWRSEPQFTKTP